MQLIRSAHKPDAASRQPTETFTGTVHMDPIFQASDCMVCHIQRPILLSTHFPPKNEQLKSPTTTLIKAYPHTNKHTNT